MPRTLFQRPLTNLVSLLTAPTLKVYLHSYRTTGQSRRPLTPHDFMPSARKGIEILTAKIYELLVENILVLISNSHRDSDYNQCLFIIIIMDSAKYSRTPKHLLFLLMKIIVVLYEMLLRKAMNQNVLHLLNICNLHVVSTIA